MAAKTPVSQGTTGYVSLNGAYSNVVAGGTTVLAQDTVIPNIANLKWQRFYFTALDDDDTFACPVKYPLFALWEGSSEASVGMLKITSVGSGTGGSTITFYSDSTNALGWIWVGSRG